ncbi:sugar phosphate isomerase/epimerase family protein [Mycolicibacterium sp. 050158]|uniref:sugar phosphate isomerase/epimerase family protein n=1 Tax=Mycolicibacterium sp. 050158 TaxID=3090602 RepID=UPI00299E16E5|nr:sugar phosphate isomerase/epimerase family protein [Mycolicibacterium sp. 050158]MDX1891690.1 sugar phosphate isomerase/epimerase family protein [Mycolicibacterium sp. 050158]
MTPPRPIEIASSEWVLGDRDQALARTATAGLTAVELDARPDLDAESVRTALGERGLSTPSLCWQWNPDAELGSPDGASRLAAQRYLAAAMEQAEHLGATQVVVVPACREVPWQDEPRPAGVERAASAIREVLRDAPARVQLSLEALRTDESFLLNTLDEADRLREMIDDDRVTLLADLYHLADLDGDLDEIVGPHADKISLVHFAAADRTRITSATHRVAEVISVLTAAGFDGSVTLEYTVPDDDDLRRAAEFARQAWNTPREKTGST